MAEGKQTTYYINIKDELFVFGNKMFKYVKSHFVGDAETYIGRSGDIIEDDNGTLFIHDGETSGGNILPKTKSINLSQAQLLACHTTPIELVPSPGVGKAIVVTCLITSSRIVSSFHAGANAGLSYFQDGSDMYKITTDPFMAITNGRNSFTVSYPTPNNAASFKMDNSSVTFTADANFTGGNGSSVTLTVVYTIVPLAQDGAGDF